MNAAITKQIRDQIRREIAGGYTPIREIPTVILESFEEEEIAGIRKKDLAAMTKELVDEHLKKQAKWPKTTDYDRLRAAFADLEKQGVVARENFSCCGNCGSYEIGEEIEEAQNRGREIRGYVFFHMQDTESAVAGDGLYFHYGSVEGSDDDARGVAKLLVGALKNAGLEPSWGGKVSKRVQVPLVWKRRRRT